MIIVPLPSGAGDVQKTRGYPWMEDPNLFQNRKGRQGKLSDPVSGLIRSVVRGLSGLL
jgi:hypothetical protein